MLELWVKISKMDYSAIADKAIPIILEIISQDERNGKLVRLLSKYKSVPNAVVNAALHVLPQKTKDEIAMYLMVAYEEKLVESLNRLAVDQ